MMQFSSVPIFEGRFSHLKYAASQAPIDGYRLEFGVHTASTLNFLSATYSELLWWGFDSFQGLPEDWVRSKDGSRRSVKGEFSLAKPPRIEPNAQLVVGFFEETLPSWCQEHRERIAFIHVDCDLFSSCETILRHLDKQIIEGTVIVFDELRDWSEQGIYECWEAGEWKALNNWLTQYNRKVTPISRTNWIEGAVKVTK